MKLVGVIVFLLICQRNAPATADVSSNNLTPRILAKDIKGHECNQNAVPLARKVIFELELFNLIHEVVQATCLTKEELIFEMGSSLQALQVKIANDRIKNKWFEISIAQQDFPNQSPNIQINYRN